MLLLALSPLVIFAVWALVVFLGVKVLAIIAEKIYTTSTGKHFSEAWSNSLIFAICAAVSVIAPMKACEHMNVRRYEAALPPALDVTDLIYYSEEGPNENCGAAIFKLSPTTVAQIKGQGLAYFDKANWGRGIQSDQMYRAWRSTPKIDSSEERALRGFGCLSRPPEVWSSILQATQNQGAFFALGSGYDLLVLPELRLVVLSFDG